MYEHVLCIYPYRDDRSRHSYFPPLGLEIVASALSPYAREITIVDLRHEAGMSSDFIRPETDLVCVSINWDYASDFVREQIRAIPEGVTLIAGGREATQHAERWLTDCPNIDVLVRGGGEETVAEIAAGVPIEKIDGVSCRRDGRVVHNLSRRSGPLRDDLYPDRSLRRYRYAVELGGIDTGISVDALEGSRGCPYSCKFCTLHLDHLGDKPSYTKRSPESLADEIAEMDAEVVVFIDELFTHDMDWVSEVCDVLLERGLKKRYVAHARVDAARRMDVVRKMEQTGFIILLIGLESAQDKSLKAMTKGFGTERARKAFAELRQCRMLLHGYFIVGCIGESEAEMREITPYARSLGIDTMALTLLQRSPFDDLQGWIDASPGIHVAPNSVIYSDDYSPQRLREIRHAIWREFHTPRHFARVAWKLVRMRILTLRLLLRLAGAGVRNALGRRGARRARTRASHARAAASLLILLGLVWPAASPAQQIRAGVGVQEMSVPPGTPLAGYSGRRTFPDVLGLHKYAYYLRASDDVPRDPIRAKALLLDRAGEQLLFLSLDVVGVSWEMRKRILFRIAGIGPGFETNEVFASGTHTHSGPGAISSNGLIEFTASDRFHSEVYDAFMAAVEQAVQKAVADLGPARLLAYEFKAVGLQENRNDNQDASYFDDVANVLLVREPPANGKWRAAMVNLAIHATALSDKSDKLSADIPGEIERAFGAVLQDSSMPEPVPVLFFNGAEGDVAPASRGEDGIVSTGADFAAQAEAALVNAAPVTPTSWNVRTTAAPVQVKTPFYYYAAKLGFSNFPLWNQLGISAAAWLPATARIWSIRLGGLRLMTWPGEPTTSIGLALRKQALDAGATHAWVLGLTNGHGAYFTTRADYYDKDEYSAEGSLYGPDAGEKLLNEHHCLMQ